MKEYVRREPWKIVTAEKPVTVDESLSEVETKPKSPQERVASRDRRKIEQAEELKKQRQANHMQETRKADLQQQQKLVFEIKNKQKELNRAFAYLQDELQLERKQDKLKSEDLKYEQNHQIYNKALNSVPQAIEKITYYQLPKIIHELKKMIEEYGHAYPGSQPPIALSREKLERLEFLVSKMLVIPTGVNVSSSKRIIQNK